MELKDYLRVLRRNWILITACTVFGVLTAGVLSLSVAPTYTAQTRLFAALQTSGSVAELQQGNSFTQARIESYAETAETPLVLQPVIDSLGLEVTPAELAENIEASSDVNTVLLTIAASHPSPVQAAAIAQAVADSLVERIEDLETTAEDGASPVKLSVVTPAIAPTAPSAPNTRLNLALGLVVGLIIGLTAALLRTTLDTRLRGEADLRRITDSPVLGGIAFDSDATKKPLLTQAPAQSPRTEAFRQIRTNLQFSHVSHASKTVLVTSSLPGEGKSTTAINLAIAMAQSGQSVVLIDADLRRPRVDEYLGLERNAGLTTALVGRADVRDLLQPWGEHELYVLTSGQIPPNPSELLGSKTMKKLIAGLEDTFDAVIIDAPPLLPVTDAAVLAQQVGGVVMVIGSSKVKLPDVQKSLASLEMVDADVLGVVLNLLPTKGPDAYAYSYYSYESSPAKNVKVPADGSKARGRSRIDSDFDEKVLRARPNQS
ncbi:chromosome partitioning protein [Arthrobacter sp. Soil782]|uniref:polysaccharide biosynthesis tyrosine autokinase n=1 Tax=Arthrobacter sp. Soil782 TaxID=1736410 RepID=UPI0006F3F6C1|nr:polysaccharide biosynthesis tyrosine autokinase [Arthrobacter sp. Soil782]KRF05097.1 chromosome partitioning protein [Arthrobacter sp. Soil782]